MPRAGQARNDVADSSASTFSFDAIGTRWEIDSPQPVNATIRDQILERIRAFDTTYSRS